MANRNHAQAHLAQLDNALLNCDHVQVFLAQMVDVLDGNNFTPTDDSNPSILITTDQPIAVDMPDITAFSAIPFTPSINNHVTTSIINNDMYFEAYLSSPHEHFPSAFSVLNPIISLILNENSSQILPLAPTLAFSASTFPFNSVLDSGCTHYIIHDKALF